jgi:hypothetical protein
VPPEDLLDTPIRGWNGNLILGTNALTIERGAKGTLRTMYLRGDKVIPYDSIVAIQLKKPGMAVGYIQFSLRGGSEAKQGIGQAKRDENTITFNDNYRHFKRVHEFVLSRIGGT